MGINNVDEFDWRVLAPQVMSLYKRSDYRFSVIIHSDDLALVNCFRALCQHCQNGGNVRISWGGTGRDEWEKGGHNVKFHFKSLDERQGFIDEAKRLFPQHLWEEGKSNDNDPRPET